MEKLIEWLENQRRVAIELKAPSGECELLYDVITKAKEFNTEPSEQKPSEGAEDLEAEFEKLFVMNGHRFGYAVEWKDVFNWAVSETLKARNEAIQECIEELKEKWTAPEVDIETSVGIDYSIEILRKKLKII